MAATDTHHKLVLIFVVLSAKIGHEYELLLISIESNCIGTKLAK